MSKALKTSINSPISFKDCKKDIPKVMDYLERKLFTESTTTMMNDEYIKSNVVDLLCQVTLQKEGVVELNKDGEALTKAMLRASLSEKDLNFILNATLKCSGITVNIKDSPEQKDKDGKPVETTPEEANKMLKQKMEQAGSIDTLITLVEENLGSSRVYLTSSMQAKHKAYLEGMSSNTEVIPERDVVYVERPLQLDINYLDLTKIDNVGIYELLNSFLSSDSNSELGISVPLAIFTKKVLTCISKDIQAIAEQSVSFCKTAACNSISFTQEQDGFKTLFDSL